MYRWNDLRESARTWADPVYWLRAFAHALNQRVKLPSTVSRRRCWTISFRSVKISSLCPSAVHCGKAHFPSWYREQKKKGKKIRKHTLSYVEIVPFNKCYYTRDWCLLSNFFYLKFRALHCGRDNATSRFNARQWLENLSIPAHLVDDRVASRVRAHIKSA